MTTPNSVPIKPKASDEREEDKGWRKDLDIKPALAMSAGYLVYSDSEHIVLALDSDPDGYHAGRGQIPRGMVLDIRIIKKADLPKEGKTENEKGIQK
jgi:hypothetical protein